MKDKKKGLFDEVSRDVRDVAADVRADDGVDPRDESKGRRRERAMERPGQGHGVHKQEQFHSQVQMAIETALQTSPSPILNSLVVEEVVPQGGSLVAVLLLPERDSADAVADLREATRALEEATPRVRREVAGAITRKETPNLSFVVLPPGARKVDE